MKEDEREKVPRLLFNKVRASNLQAEKFPAA